MASQKNTARAVIDEAGGPLSRRAGIRLADRPAPLWQLLVLVNLLSARISAGIAVAAARELNAAGGTTPRGMAGLTWQQRVDALGRGHYVRYDESTATRLGECARMVLDDYGGDLRRLGAAAGGSRGRLEEALRRFPGIGPTGAAMFCREAQEVWPWLRPYTDRRARDGAARLGLPESEARLGALVPGQDTAAFAAGLAAAARDDALIARIRAAAA
ncbi:endonuclease [Nocardiopsis sediminis]|uniref:Endonuclease n=1 Tax=Nocardiopsis sediminis TaxID=1778267 RepID=A0ABV8FHC3_9ACTN